MKIAATLAWQNLGDDFVVVDVRAGRFLGMNSPAGRIIEWVSDGRDVDAMVAAMTAEFEVSPERASADIDRFLTTLCRRGLVIR